MGDRPLAKMIPADLSSPLSHFSSMACISLGICFQISIIIHIWFRVIDISNGSLSYPTLFIKSSLPGGGLDSNPGRCTTDPTEKQPLQADKRASIMEFPRKTKSRFNESPHFRHR